jgi:hypothetical protein
MRLEQSTRQLDAASGELNSIAIELGQGIQDQSLRPGSGRYCNGRNGQHRARSCKPCHASCTRRR